MKSPILLTASKYLLPILLLFSFFLLLRGRYYPGGGFVGGLVAAIAFVLHSFAFDTEATMKILKRKPLSLIPTGLAISALIVTIPILFGLPPMTGMCLEEPIQFLGMIGSSLFFDLGVYLVVNGLVLTILFTISLNNLEEKN